MPLFSVIIPVYNRAKLIGPALDSVLAQKFCDYELIVVDDGSTDETPDVVTGYSARYPQRMFVLRQSNAGPGAARNAGIARATGKYITFLDSDDLWFPWALDCHARAIKDHGSPALVSGRWTSLNTLSKLSDFQPPAWTAQLYPCLFAAAGRILPIGGTPSVAIDAQSLRQAGGFPPQFINGEDQDLWLRLGCAQGFAQIKDPPIYAHRQHDERISSNIDRSVAGARYVATQERAGAYPGGNRFLKVRLETVTGLFRNTSIDCAKTNRLAEAWSLYWESASWHVKLFRWKYLLAFPLMVMLSFLRPHRIK